MKRNTDNSNLFKGTIVILFLLAVTSVTFAQTRPPQPVRRATITMQYVLKEGKITGDNVAVYQELFDSLGRLHTEVEYGNVDHYPHKYKWHTFKGKQIARTDFFENEKLQMIYEYTYNSDSLLSKEIVKKVKPGDTTTYLTLNYKYNLQKKPIQIDAKSATGRTAYKTKSKFDDKGTEISRIVNTKAKYTPLDSIVKLTSKPVYDSLGRLSTHLVSITKSDKTTTHRTYKYSYDKKNNIRSIAIFDSNGKQISREERLFQEDRNRLALIKFFDSNDNIVKCLGKRYEIYRNKNRRIYEIDY